MRGGAKNFFKVHFASLRLCGLVDFQMQDNCSTSTSNSNRKR